MQPSDSKLQFRLPVQDHIDLDIYALTNRMNKSDLIAQAMIDAMSGVLGPLETDGYRPSSATIDKDLIASFKQFSKARGEPQNTLLTRAIKAKLAQLSGDIHQK